MKLKFVAALFVIGIGMILFTTSSSNGRATAANAGNTGAPGESQLCGNCHNGGAFGPVSVSIQMFLLGTTTPVTSYIPGESYNLRVTVSNNSGNPVGYGFQLTALTTPGNLPLAGYSSLASNVKQKTVTVGAVAGRTYIEHNGVTTNNVFNCVWTAPASGSGSIRFYAAGNAVNGNSSTSLDNSGSTSFTITESLPLLVDYNIIQNQCFNSNNGEIELFISGGNPPYSVEWADGSTDLLISGLAAGNYNAIISDNLGEVVEVDLEITQPEEIVVDISTSNALFFGGTGSASINVSGGTAPLSITYSPSIENLDQIPAGEYQVFVEDVNGCSISETFVIEQPNDYSVEATTSNNLCFGDNNGSIQLSVSGATAPYTFLWSDGNLNEDRIDLLNGIYTVSITDANGYTYSETFNIESPAAFFASAQADAIPCVGGETTVTFELSGGTTPYATDSSPLVVNTPGIYNYEFIDANGCTATANLTVESLDGISLELIDLSQPICSNDCNGSITVQTNNAIGEINYQWSNGSTSSEIVDLCAGEYSVLVTDESGCTFFAEYTVINPPSLLAQNVELILLEEDTFYEVNILPNGGVAPYSFLIDPAPETEEPITLLYEVPYTITITDANGCSISGIKVNNPGGNVRDRENNISFSVYPNPVERGQSIIVDDIEDMHSYSISALNGQILHEDQVSPDNKFISTDQLSSGLYLLSIQHPLGTWRHKILIH